MVNADTAKRAQSNAKPPLAFINVGSCDYGLFFNEISYSCESITIFSFIGRASGHRGDGNEKIQRTSPTFIY